MSAGHVNGATGLTDNDIDGRLDNIALDVDYNIGGSDNENLEENESVGECSSNSNGNSDMKSDSSSNKSDEKENTRGKGNEGKAPKDSKKDSSVFSKLKRLTKYDKETKPIPTSKPVQPDPTANTLESTNLLDIRVDRLPQVFVCKYLGKRSVKGVYGLHYVRKPVDEMIGKVKKTLQRNEVVELPLVYIVISNKGIDVREHKHNRIKEGVTYGNIPIDFISYGVQDMKFWKVFTFIIVSELSSRTKKMDCHAYLCDSSGNARKMALSLGASFQLYKTKLAKEGKAHNFQVELRPPDKLAEEFSKSDEEEEC